MNEVERDNPYRQADETDLDNTGCDDAPDTKCDERQTRCLFLEGAVDTVA